MRGARLASVRRRRGDGGTIPDRAAPPARSVQANGDPAGGTVRDGFIRRWVHRADVHRVLVRPEVRSQPSLDGPGVLRGRTPPGGVLDRLRTIGVPDRVAEHDGVHAPPLERAPGAGSIHADARVGDGGALGTLRAVADGRARPAGLCGRHGRSGGAYGCGRVHPRGAVAEPPLRSAGRGGVDGASGVGVTVRGRRRPEDRLRRLALCHLPEGAPAEGTSRGVTRRGHYSSSSSACMITGARATTCAPSSTRIVRTPWLARPTRRMSPAATRMTMPEEEMTNMSWSFEPTKAPASRRVFFTIPRLVAKNRYAPSS